MPKPWFKQKRYGIGLSPAGWKGWSAIGLLVAAALALARLPPGLLRIGAGSALLIGGLLLARFAAARTPGRVRWRWGERD